MGLKFFFEKSKKKELGQGTLEYLMVIGILIVVGLAVGILMINQNESVFLIQDGLFDEASKEKELIITDSSLTTSGDIVLSIQNKAERDLIITKITPVNKSSEETITLLNSSNNCNGELRIGHSRQCLIPNASEVCNCASSTASSTVNCYYQIDYNTPNGIMNKKLVMSKVKCNSNVESYTLEYKVSTDENENGGVINGELVQKILKNGVGSEVKAIPNPGWKFKHWSDGKTDPKRIDYELKADLIIYAIFELENN